MLDTDDDDAVRRLLASAVRDVPSGIDLVAGVHKVRAARRTRIRAALAATATFVIASGTTVGLTLSQAPSALAAVTAAAARTASQSYRVTGTAGLGFEQDTYSGAFDPAHGTGEVITRTVLADRPVEAETVIAGGYLYVRALGSNPLYAHWGRFPLVGSEQILWLPGSRGSKFTNPSKLLAGLQTAGQVRQIGHASGRGWTGTRYAFTARPFSGTVEVDQQGRVRAIYSTVGTGGLSMTTTAVFSDFGKAVHVKVPRATEPW